MKALWIINCIAIVYAASPKFDSCRTPAGKLGECKVITGCPHLLDLLQVQPLSHATMTFLKRSNCGFQGLDPKVCCDEDLEYGDVEPPPGNDYKPEKNIDSNLLPNKEDCGAATQNRIVGGEATDLDEFPWMVLLEYEKTYGRGFHCGGVLISKRYVLTAAHCVKGKDLPTNWDLVSVRLGEYNTETDLDCETQNRHTYCADKPVDVTITEKIVHEKYNSYDANQHHDIALLRLAKDVRFTSFIKPVCFPNVAELLQKDFSGINMTVAGWGKTESKSESNVKLKLQIPVKSIGDCSSVYSSKGISVGPGQLCAGGVEGKDSCRGDSGGPLMTEFFASGLYNWYVTGIVSFGPSPCGIEGWPGIYTKVTNYVPWIINHMRP